LALGHLCRVCADHHRVGACEPVQHSLSWPILVQRSPLYQGPVAVVVNDEELLLSGGQSESRICWDDCVGYKMSEDLVLLYIDSGAFTTVPRAFFPSEDDWQRFRDHVQRALPRQTARSSSILRWLLFALIMLVMAACAILSILLEVLSGPGS
jgi:hypothetical protein